MVTNVNHLLVVAGSVGSGGSGGGGGGGMRGDTLNLPLHTGMSVIEFPTIVELNVGGQYFKTSLSTLRKYPDSMLGAMFSGRYQVDRDENGHYFIDRNGALFTHILEFLRTGSLPPGDASASIYREAMYYGLETLVERLRTNRGNVARLVVQELHRGQFPNYSELKEQIVAKAIQLAAADKMAEVKVTMIPSHAFRQTDVHVCVADQADFKVGPWQSEPDAEILMRCLAADMQQDGFIVTVSDKSMWCNDYFCNHCLKKVYALKFSFTEEDEIK